jgi:hypothetical protein
MELTTTLISETSSVPIADKNKIKKNKQKEDNNYLNEITIDCLLNKKLYGSYLGYDNEGKKAFVSSKDKRFYRKRIQQLTKDLLSEVDEKETKDKKETKDEKETKELICPPEVKDTFNTYISLCIRHFKMVDFNDINQDMIGVTDKDTYIDKSVSADENDIIELTEKHLMRSIHIPQPTLDGFVKRINSKVEEVIIPQKKKINLKEPSLKTKGIKKNITSNYEEGTDIKNEKTEEEK